MIDPGVGLKPEPPIAPDRPARPAQSYWSQSWERLRSNRIGIIAGLVLVVLTIIALGAPLIEHLVTHVAYSKQDLTSTFRPPGPSHLLGADELGRDTLTRLVYGARVSLGIGFLAVALSILVGGLVGIAAGYYGGLVDEVLMRLVDTLLAIPSIFLFILMSILFKPSPAGLAAILAFVGWGPVSRLVRGDVLSIRSRDFMLATRSLGAGDVRLMLAHLLPNVLPVMIVYGSLNVGQIILAESALSFLGLGVHPPIPSWGNMLTNSQTYFFHSIWLVVFPGAAIFLTVLVTNLFGNAVRDAFDPRLR